jgi:pantoate--beta-alanine ligase
MQVFDHPAAMAAWSDEQRRIGRRIGFVPTMGALHDGHLALMGIAHQHADIVVASIFVNPLQFDRRDDFDRYPRPLDDDLHACAAVGVEVVYAPTAAAMYPPDFQTHVEPGALAEPLEGAGRPGHFRGVTTVVTKLLTAVRPHVAVFGQKDYQQLAVVRRLVADLDLGVTIVAAPTVREGDGLALSSRNRRLSPQDRSAAVAVPRALEAIVHAYAQGERVVASLEATGRALLDAEPRARVEYLSVVDAAGLNALEVLDRDAVAVAAVWFGDIRLIDNVALPAPHR